MQFQLKNGLVPFFLLMPLSHFIILKDLTNLKGPGIRKYPLKNDEYGLLKLEAILVSWSRGSVLILSMSSLTHVVDTKESPK